MTDLMLTLKQAGELTAADSHFADLMQRLDGGDNAALWLAAALASRATGEGHVCLDLGAEAARPLSLEGRVVASLPGLGAWRDALRASAVVGSPGDFRPLILTDDDRLYLQRYWQYEQNLAVALRRRANADSPELDLVRLGEGLARLFARNDGQQPDWQRLAAAVALLKPFSVISGGPGTGKTATVVRLLALLLEQAGDQPLHIALAAPTGKAAARMQEAIRNALQDLPVADGLRERIPAEASTLHRLLGVRPHSLRFRHHRDNPLPLDVLIVDEASMVDLSLMARLVDALPPTARLILLGDRDQLASVEAGAVLAELGQGGERFSPAMQARLENATGMALPAQPGAGIDDCVVQLQRSYRFDEHSGIGHLARAVNAGDGAAAMHWLQAGLADVDWLESPQPLGAELRERVLAGYRPYLEAMRAGESPQAVLAAFERFRVLAALRRGEAGVERLNAAIEAMLTQAGLIRPAGGLAGGHYAGQPLMIRHNDPATRLYNGDVGLLLPDTEAGGELRAFFAEGEGVRRLRPAQLPAHELVYAMTVHKSQGSEFDAVLMVLPPAETPLLTRELLYTGITRARKRVALLGEARAVAQGCSRQVQREGGLGKALRS